MAEANDSEQIETESVMQICANPQRIFTVASSTEGLPAIFPGKGIIPGVVSARLKDGTRDIAVGKTRLCLTEDNNEVEETYIHWDPPHGYAYEMTKLKAPLSWMLSKATGRWTLEERLSEKGECITTVTWRYTGDIVGGISTPFSYLLVKYALSAAMDECLARVKALSETPCLGTIRPQPSWQPDEECDSCPKCANDFSLLNRRHHCRNCGSLVCGDCSRHTSPLPHYLIAEAVRVCTECASKIQEAQKEKREDHYGGMEHRSNNITNTHASNDIDYQMNDVTNNAETDH